MCLKKNYMLKGSVTADYVLQKLPNSFYVFC